ncbi:MAG: transposase [Gemmatimonadota bacterium]
MARRLRPHQPGAAFHIVSRTQGKTAWFTPAIKRQVSEWIQDGVASAGARLIAHVVMDNHLHVLLFQGSAPLGWTMQPILHRTALLVQRVHGVEGHVFERNFRCKQCESTEHVRNAIRYIHRNPVAARMCESPADYEFSSARAYEGLIPCGHICVRDGLQVFGSSDGGSEAERRAQYVADLSKPLSAEMTDFFEYWLWKRRRRHNTAFTHWVDHRSQPATDIRDAALQLLKVIAPELDVELVRSRYGGPVVVAARLELIASLLQRGYPGIAVAGYVRVSRATVSRVRSRMRWAAHQDRAG